MYSNICVGFLVVSLLVCVGSIPVEPPANSPPTSSQDSPQQRMMGICNPGLMCPATGQPVCGSNRVTYPTLCHFQTMRRCIHDNVYIAHYGACENQRCRKGCPKLLNRVCGSDGETYNNLCELENAKRCDGKPGLHVDHYGACFTPPSCRHFCPLITGAMVCGTDGKNYPSRCDLDNARRCDGKPGLRVDHNGPCFTPPSCRRLCGLILNKVCGSDGKTYDSKCELENTKRCDHKPGLHVRHDGACVAPPPCRRACPLSLFKICGTDNKTYENECELDNARRCDGKRFLQKAHDGACVPPPWG